MKWLLGAPLLIYFAICVLMFFAQRNLQYLPSREPLDPKLYGLEDIEHVRLTTADNETITAWHKAASPGFPMILYFHGNGRSLAYRSEKIAAYASSGFGLLAVSYRGYGDSTGTPTEAGLMADAHAAYDWSISRNQAGVMLVGESLGSGVAVQLAAAKPVRAVALEAPFFSAVDVGAQAYWFLPVRLLLKDKFRSSDHIAAINAPLLIQHGNADNLIPLSQGEALFNAATKPKRMVVIEGGTHFMIGEERIWRAELEFFRAVMDGTFK